MKINFNVNVVKNTSARETYFFDSGNLDRQQEMTTVIFLRSVQNSLELGDTDAKKAIRSLVSNIEQDKTAPRFLNPLTTILKRYLDEELSQVSLKIDEFVY
jgi:carbamate kinase